MDSGWLFVAVAFTLVWGTLAGYMLYLAQRARAATAALTPPTPAVAPVDDARDAAP